MFGYITPEKPELKVREYELYRAVYCGICKAIGKKYGQLPRLTVTYDSAFMALLLSGISGECTTLKRETCVLHPVTRKCSASANASINYSADMNILLAYFNLKDKWIDDRSVPAGALELALKLPYAGVKRKYGEKCRLCETYIGQLHRLEAEKCASMDMAAEPFARLLEEVMDFGEGGFSAGQRDALRWMGYNTGKWIYILDAFDDIGKDIRSGSYNPLLLQFGFSGGENKIESFKDSIKERVGFNLTQSLSQIVKSYDIIDIKCNSGIIENIIYLGMLKKTDGILNKGSCKKIDQSL